MRRILSRVLMAIGFAGLLTTAIQTASASTVTYDVTFGAGTFEPSSPPVGLVVGHFGVTLDPTQNSSGAATLFGITLPTITSGLFYNYIASSQQLQLGTNEFLLTITGLASAPNFVSFVYHQYFSGGAPTPPYLAGAGNVLVTATPIPAALPLFVSALGGLGYLGWRRRKAAA